MGNAQMLRWIGKRLTYVIDKKGKSGVKAVFIQ